MTDRVNGLFVSLDQDYREDKVQKIIETINMIKGVSDCKVNIVDAQSYFHRDRIRNEIGNKIIKLVHEEFYK